MTRSGSRRLRVLLWHWGRRGGGPRYTLELAKVLVMRDDLEVFLSLSRQSEMYADFANIPVAGRFDIDTYTSLPQFAWRTLQVPWLRRRFGAYLRRERIDVVLCTMDHMWDSFVVSAIRPAGALYLLTVHDAMRHPGEDQRIRQWLLRRDIAASDGALVLTESVRELLISGYSYPHNRTFTSAHGAFSYGRVDVPRELPDVRPVRLLFFGRIIAYKGLGLMLSALPQLQAEFPGLSLEIWGAGDIGPYRSQLSSLGAVKLENRWIREDEIAGIFERTDLAILPYTEASQSGVVAIAFAAGMPCVATPIPGLLEQIDNDVTGVVAMGMEPDNVAEAIARILRDRTFYHRLSAGCLYAAKTSLNWNGIGNTVAVSIHELYALGARR
jgi:glycosyltransferase involved in cell wall biosynthesis